MSEITFRFSIDNTDRDSFVFEKVTFPLKHTDVMDGSFDTGSFEAIITYDEYQTLISDDNYLKEGNFITRTLYLDGQVIDNKGFMIDDFNVEKDSTYDENYLKLTIKYVETTKYLTTLMCSNQTYTISPGKWNDSNYNKERNSLLDVFKKSFETVKERNNILNKDFLSSTQTLYRYLEPSEKLLNTLKEYPNKNKTYLDSNFFDIYKDICSDISAVPYLSGNMLNELTFISSMGEDNNKELNNDNQKIVVSNSYNRNMQNNCEVIENKAVNIYEDREYIWYPFLSQFNKDNVPNNAYNFARPKGLNEGLEQYQYWYNWYLELPYNIDTILEVYCLIINKPIIYTGGNMVANNELINVTNRIVEQSIYEGLTETEKKYYSYYKKGSNRINSIVVSAGITTEDDNWPWEKAKDNEKAFRTAFLVKYKPILDTDVTVVKNGKRTFNKKNIAFANKNISDADLLSKTKYELDKNYYSQYMLEIAGEYQHITAGEIVNISGFENYGIPTKKYLIYKVDTTFEKEGCHQIIYFNEMVAKNNVLLNENNLVRISQNPSYDSVIDRIYKKTDLVGINCEYVDSKSKENYNRFDCYGGYQFIYNSLKNILTPNIDDDIANMPSYYSYLGSISFKTILDVLDTKLNIQYGEETPGDYYYCPSTVMNSGTVSQIIGRAQTNYIIDNQAIVDETTPDTTTLTKTGELKESRPISYTDILGYVKKIEAYFVVHDYDFYFQPSSLVNGSFPKITNFSEVSPYVNHTLYFDRKDARENLVIVYEESWYTNNEDCQLTDFFTSCGSSFGGNKDLEGIDIKRSKDILIFPKKIYNINSIDINESEKTINNDDYYNNIVNWDGGALYIKLSNNGVPFRGNVGEEIEEYSFVIRGVNNYISEDIYYKTPQIVITVPKHTVKEEEYIKLTLEAYKL